MKAITLLAVAAMLLVEIFGSKASVGGSMSFMLVFVLVMLAVAIYEAWSNERGAIGWIVNLLASAVGGLVAVALIGMAVEAMLPYLHLEGSLASSQHPLKYVLVAAIAICMVLGSWLPLLAVNRFRH
ncbi:hypothetical protein IVB25_20110 [Bradyrhizobium sp. 193]|uniref:hypothetical protein n=1 Tax=unclassified Bradyrhizobium TaxID=2631580 RepID=UPI001FF96C22|nr:MULTISPECIES: hypothetical protein [unclassified Bradyrhizobium]MCK1346322.1 hypothetical protein [Bradyrhizobium sp. CW11]MCK1467925.1 hypothetical protein [Bradyrhizobium sp. CW10]MCK1484931.1 hypothetical protein [Bradyrhizobium sp. 193]MCK1582717.1 hypothetical protein [Bradyrhizobium sp. 168]MCK1588516.1 hypothetical protein [Bradyrhizobium sp. 169]